MTRIKTTGLVAAVCGLLAIFAADASAQAPTLSATANGDSVTILWNALPGATGYTLAVGTAPGQANLATVNLPASITRIVVRAPYGTYYLRVNAFAGGLIGPPSNEASVTSAPAPACQPPAAAPTANPSVLNNVVTVNWNHVTPDVTYRVEFSVTPNGVNLVQNVGAATTAAQSVPVPGTFYVRIVAINSCGGALAGPTVPFTVGNDPPPPPPPNGGNRTPDPPPGQLLPIPAYAYDVVRNAARVYAADLAAHSGPACKANNTWLFKLLRDLRQRDTRWGLNWKRGWGTEMSTDIITYNPGNGPDEGATHVYLADVLSGECETNAPVFNWERVTQDTWAANGLYPGLCANSDCAKWTIAPYVAAGFPVIP